jgi:fructose/tagatose bisphosphate aldolase
MSEASPYRKLRVMPHLDHAFPWLDGDVLDIFADKFASVMCDASEKPFEENIRLTAEYVDKVKGRVVVEGAVDEVFESGGTGEKNEPTTVEQAKKYLSETGIDIIVPNVGTEHRATADHINYRSDCARQISHALGKILCLHGTSSVKPEALPTLPDDGFIKINIYTTLAVHGGQAVARNVLANLGNIFDEAQLGGFATQRIIGPAPLDPNYGETVPPIKPKLDRVANPHRRDAWLSAVRDRCGEFLRVFGYAKYAG